MIRALALSTTDAWNDAHTRLGLAAFAAAVVVNAGILVTLLAVG